MSRLKSQRDMFSSLEIKKDRQSRFDFIITFIHIVTQYKHIHTYEHTHICTYTRFSKGRHTYMYIHPFYVWLFEYIHHIMLMFFNNPMYSNRKDTLCVPVILLNIVPGPL